MYEEIRAKAVKKLEEKIKRRKGIRTVGLVFTMAAIILFVLSTQFHPAIRFWVRFPILVLSLVYGVIHFSEYGLPFTPDEEELSEEDIEREMVKIYRKSNLNTIEDRESEGYLELREVEELKEKYNGNQDFV